MYQRLIATVVVDTVPDVDDVHHKTMISFALSKGSLSSASPLGAVDVHHKTMISFALSKGSLGHSNLISCFSGKLIIKWGR